MPDDLTDDQRWQWRASLIADLTGMDDAWFEFDSPTDRAYLEMIADGLLEVGWRFGGVPKKAASPTLAETRTGTDWCSGCQMEVGTNRYQFSDGNTEIGPERCGSCASELVARNVVAEVSVQELGLAIYRGGLASTCHQNTIARNLMARYNITPKNRAAGQP